MISKRMKLEDVNEAFRAMKAGEVARSVHHTLIHASSR
jgi:Zn-dependent alcohol dehydrogenase